MSSSTRCPLVALVLGVLFGAGAFGARPVVTGVSPDAVPYGSADTRITVTGRNFAPDSRVELKLISAVLATTWINESTLEATVASDVLFASSLQRPLLNVTGSTGDSNSIEFWVEQPVITSVTPSRVNAGSGSFTATLYGRGFSPATVVGGVDRSEVTYLGPTSISVRMEAPATPTTGLGLSVGPRSNLYSSSIRIYVTDGTPAGSPPVISSVSPTAIYVGSQSDVSVIIDGSGFTRESKALLDNGESGIQTIYESPTRLKVNLSYPYFRFNSITVVNPPGMVSNVAQVALRPLVISSLTPNRATAGSAGVTVDIAGEGFTRSTKVKLASGTGTSDGTLDFVSSTKLRLFLSAGTLFQPGVKQIRLTQDNIAGPLSMSEFVVEPSAALAISSVAPASVFAGSGPVALTLTGQGFSAGTTLAYTTWSGASGTLPVSAVTATSLSATLPAGLFADAGVVTLTATEAGGASASIAFPVNPVLTALGPTTTWDASSSSARTVPVTLTGSGFGTAPPIRSV